MPFDPALSHIERRLHGKYPYASVEDAFLRIVELMNELHNSITRYWDIDRIVHQFHLFQAEFILLHKAITLVVIVMGEPVFIYKELGLRVDEEAWSNPPPTSAIAFAELERIVNQVGDMLEVRRTPYKIPDYLELLEDFRRSLRYVRINEFLLSIYIRRSPLTSFGIPRYASITIEEQNDEVGERDATNGGAGQICHVCFDHIVTGQRIRTLFGENSFHQTCIDPCLRAHAPRSTR